MSGIEVRGLRVGLRGTGAVLQGIDLAAAPGECLAVVGESGAGKSVLARTLLGLTQSDPDARVEADVFALGDRDVRTLSRREWRTLRGREVSLVLQDALASLDPLRTIEAEVGEALAVRRVSVRERRRRVIAALAEANLDNPEARLRQRSGELSGGMRQRVLIASALVAGAGVIVADEPTTALDATVAARILALLGRLRDEGRTVVLISHDLRHVARIADRVAVIADGRVVETGPTAAVLTSPQHPVTRALCAAAPRGPKSQPSPAPGAELIVAEGLVRRYHAPGVGPVTAVDDVDLRLRAVEVLGVVGASGSGKSTLARLLVGAERPDAGTVHFPQGRPGIRLVPQDPLGSFDPRWRVGRILRTAARDAGVDAGVAAAQELLDQVGLDPALAARYPAQLSGGQRQRVAIARALAARPQVLVCDEPVSALDMTAQAGILDVLLRLQRDEATAIVFVSHDLAVVRRVCDRVLVMSAGAVVESGSAERVFAAPQHPFTQELVDAAR